MNRSMFPSAGTCAPAEGVALAWALPELATAWLADELTASDEDEDEEGVADALEAELLWTLELAD